MQTIRQDRRVSQIFLCAVPFLTFFVFAWIRALRTPGVWQTLAVLQIAAIAVAAWKLGANAIRSEAEERRRLALTGVLLVAPWAFLALLIGMGPPWWATDAENRLRFEALLVCRILIPVAFVVLWATLREAGERFYSVLGLAATMLAGPLMLSFGAFPLTVQQVAFQQQAASGQQPAWVAPMNSEAALLDALEVILTYLAIAAFAVALLKIGWIRRKASRAFVWFSLFAVLCMVVAVAVGLQFPALDFQNASRGIKIAIIPGFIVGIPAIPFIMPCLIGVTLLRRAGEEMRTESVSVD